MEWIKLLIKKYKIESIEREIVENELNEISRLIKSHEDKKTECENHLRNIEIEMKAKLTNYEEIENELKAVK